MSIILGIIIITNASCTIYLPPPPASISPSSASGTLPVPHSGQTPWTAPHSPFITHIASHNASLWGL